MSVERVPESNAIKIKRGSRACIGCREISGWNCRVGYRQLAGWLTALFQKRNATGRLLVKCNRCHTHVHITTSWANPPCQRCRENGLSCEFTESRRGRKKRRTSPPSASPQQQPPVQQVSLQQSRFVCKSQLTDDHAQRNPRKCDIDNS
jgi:hypothetical protein